jgi:hypothetical protein
MDNNLGMCRTLIQLSQLRQTFPEVLFLHGITRIGGESDVPPEKTFADRITNAIQDSNNTKLSTHSFALRLNARQHYGALSASSSVKGMLSRRTQKMLG